METTLFPVEALPTCVTNCGPLYDANGACVPPGAEPGTPETYNTCFCNDPRLAPFKTGTGGVCDAACPQAADLSSIQAWYTDFCATATGDGENGAPTGTETGTGTARPGSSGGSQGGGGGGSWLDNHYQWVIFLVVMVVGIVGIWIGACVWRRRYLRKKDRQYALTTHLARSTESGGALPNADTAGSKHAPGASMFEPAPISSAGVLEEKKKKKWIVKERT
ncbi:hypothetical protein VTK26DRAFT_7983 [Humicola hyalothermophila]